MSSLLLKGDGECPEVKKVKIQPRDIIFFWKPCDPHGFLSNWSNHPIKQDKIIFKTVEHFFMYQKAIAMGDDASAQKIVASKTPYEAKRLGRLVRNFDEGIWDATREEIMFIGLKLKILQNPLLKAMLLATDGKILAEASPYDSVWGIGCTKEDALLSNKWHGKNLLGKLWMKTRETLIHSM